MPKKEKIKIKWAKITPARKLKRVSTKTKRGKSASRLGRPVKKTSVKKKRKETAIQQIVNHYFITKGLSTDEIKKDAKKRKIIYSRFTRPAKQLLELAGTVGKAKKAISKVAKWAQSRKLDYAIETVFKKWLELDQLKPKEIVKKPFFRDDPMVWSKTKKKWFVIVKDGEWKEFAGKESDIKWKIEK